MAITPEYLTTSLNKLHARMSTGFVFHMDLLAFSGTLGQSFHLISAFHSIMTNQHKRDIVLNVNNIINLVNITTSKH